MKRRTGLYVALLVAIVGTTFLVMSSLAKRVGGDPRDIDVLIMANTKEQLMFVARTIRDGKEVANGGMTDAWGSTLIISVSRNEVTVLSRGPDGVTPSSDDVAYSLRLDRK